MKKLWEIISGIGIFFALVFYLLYNKEKAQRYKEIVGTAKEKAKTIAKEQNDKVKNDSIATANDISKMLDN